MAKKLGGAKDIYDNKAMLTYLHTLTMDTDVTPKEEDRISQRTKRFEWEGNQLFQRLHRGETRVVPPPNGREELVLHIHEDFGHYGVRRTHNFLQHHYWWKGMKVDTQHLVARCKVCDQVRASFNAPMHELQPFPIMGLGYW